MPWVTTSVLDSEQQLRGHTTQPASIGLTNLAAPGKKATSWISSGWSYTTSNFCTSFFLHTDTWKRYLGGAAVIGSRTRMVKQMII